MTVSKDKTSWKYDFRYNNKRYRKKGFKTKKAALLAENEKLNSVSKGATMSSDTSFIQYFNKWLETNKKDKVSDKTYQCYKIAIRAFDEKFGNIPISKITQLDYRTFLKEYGQGKFLNCRKQGRTNESVRKLHNCLRGAFDDAFEAGIILRNPTYKAEPRGIRESKQESAKFMSETTYTALLNFAKDGKQLSHLFLYILCITGARFSEVANMKYSDLKEANDLIHIPGTKTKNADRVIPISLESKKHILKRIRENPRTFDDYIFNTGVSLITNNAVTKAMHRFLLKNNFKYYSLHSIRHTHASILLKEGFPIHYISKRLGHADIDVTLRTYSHLLDEQRCEEDKKLTRFMSSF